MLPFSCLPTTPAESAAMVPEPQPGQLIFRNCLALSPLERGRWYGGPKWGPDLAPWIGGLPCLYRVCMGYWGHSSGVQTLLLPFQLREATWKKQGRYKLLCWLRGWVLPPRGTVSSGRHALPLSLLPFGTILFSTFHNQPHRGVVGLLVTVALRRLGRRAGAGEGPLAPLTACDQQL